MRGTVRRRAVLGGVTVLFLSLSIAPTTASCAGPSIAFDGAPNRSTMRVAPGDEVSLVGEFWTLDCFDTGSSGSCERGPGDERPMRGIDVDLLRGGEPVVRVLENVSAGSDLRLDVTFRVPEIAGGSYRILAHDQDASGYPELWLRVSR